MKPFWLFLGLANAAMVIIMLMVAFGSAGQWYHPFVAAFNAFASWLCVKNFMEY